MRKYRVTRTLAFILATTMFLAPRFAGAQDNRSGEQQIATVEQLKTEAVRALRGGNLDRSDELIRTAASMSGDRSLAQMSEWIAQYKSQRNDFVAERHKQYEKVVSEVKKLAEAGKELAAIDRAGEAYIYADDKDNFAKEDWVAPLLKRAPALAEEYEKSDQWLKARRIWADLASIDTTNPLWKERLNSSNRRARLLALYTPDDFIKLILEDDKARQEAAAILDPTTKPAAPTTQPDDDSFKTDWKDSLKGVRIDMLYTALGEAKSSYWKDISYRKLLTGGLKGVEALVTTKGLESAFPTLADETKREAFAAVVRESLETVANLANPEDEQFAVKRIVANLRLANRRTIELPDEVIINEFADGAFAELDPFSNMIWPSDVAEFNKSTQGEFAGVGIQIQSDEEGNLKVVSPVEDTPAYKLGVKAGDIITKINGKNAKNISTTLAVKHITGAPGTEVTLTIRSGADGTEKDYTIKRQLINVASVKGWKRVYGDPPQWEYFIDPAQKIAYIRLTNFTKHSFDELQKAIQETRQQGARGVILDLRNNPGGLLVAATEISDKFLSSGTIVSTRADRESGAQPPQAVEARQNNDDLALPMVVLINEYSASASEIVAGALKDLHRATLVGARTFGKGSVQMLFPLASRSAYLKLTTSHYYLPSGRCIHREETSTTWGVDPDVTIAMTPKQMRDAAEARQDQEVIRDVGAPPTQPSTKPAKDVLASDSQLATALLLMRLQLAGGTM